MMAEEFRVVIEDRGEWDSYSKRYLIKLYDTNAKPGYIDSYQFKASGNFKWLALWRVKHAVKSARRKDKRQARARKTEHRIKV